MIKKLIQGFFAKSKVHAKLTDINGRKSGGTRDAGGNDWYDQKNVHN
jgi:hypothetical protein